MNQFKSEQKVMSLKSHMFYEDTSFLAITAPYLLNHDSVALKENKAPFLQWIKHGILHENLQTENYNILRNFKTVTFKKLNLFLELS